MRTPDSVYAAHQGAWRRSVRAETIADAVIFRPSIDFGPEDSFFNRFANMARYSPVLPLIGGGQTKFQPVYVDDVAEGRGPLRSTAPIDAADLRTRRS